jgi:hypothetical protein
MPLAGFQENLRLGEGVSLNAGPIRVHLSDEDWAWTVAARYNGKQYSTLACGHTFFARRIASENLSWRNRARACSELGFAV